MFLRTAISERVQSHLLEALARTKVEERPFAHCYIERVFPDDIYSAILRHLPDASHYRADNPGKYTRPDGVTTRNVLGLDEGQLVNLPEGERQLWSGIADGISAPGVKDAVFEMLSHDLARRFRTPRDHVREIVAYPRPGLVRDLPGYWIEPHPDTPAKIVTMQLYLPRDDSQANLGTTLYRLRLLKLRNLISPSSALEPFKMFAFRPNTGYAFAVGRTSWHGLPKMAEGSGVRDSLMNIYYRDPARGW